MGDLSSDMVEIRGFAVVRGRRLLKRGLIAGARAPGGASGAGGQA
jgi:hypothetical protein